ncbi:MAG: DNA cytosine methyltransferase [bacterium]|nr:DNA cytosine methyltransferase [bacterium]MYB24372.1 DNA cytosine methyltransferase [Acidimicrobiia bacterium]
MSPLTELRGTARVQVEGDRLERRLPVRDKLLRSHIPRDRMAEAEWEAARRDPAGAWWLAVLGGAVPLADETAGMPRRPMRVVDLFAGAGGLMVGVARLLAEAGRQPVCELAVDIDSDALAVHRRNHRTRLLEAESVTSLSDYRILGLGDAARFVYPPKLLDESVASASTRVDLVMAGPPCQGHSNLNNRSRRSDRRNLLYLAVPAFAAACDARAVLIENVPSVVHDDARVVRTTCALLRSCGYAVTEGVLAADAMGWPQSRRRHFLVARRQESSTDPEPVSLSEVSDVLAADSARSVMWAIGGGQGLSRYPAMHAVPEFTDVTRERINWLFEQDAHDLSLSERPECHQDGTSYGSVYGRMHAGRPAPTITTGFMTQGRGRFVHPTERRTLTPAEAARLQGFPDDYVFWPEPNRSATRAQLAKWIGDSVAAPLGYAAALSALGPVLAQH